MVKERSGTPSGGDSGDLHDLFGDPAASPPRAKKAPPPAKAPAPPVAADGWPSWMGDADPKLAPAPAPSRPKAASTPAAAPAAAAAAQRTAGKVSAPPRAVPPPAPAHAAEPPAPRRWLRSLGCVVAILLALVAGHLAARSRPEAAIRFQQAVTDAIQHLPAALPPALPLLGGTALVLFLFMVWQAGRPRRPLFLPLALLLCLASAGLGAFRGGHDLDIERTAGSLRKELQDWRVSASKELLGLQRKLREAQSDRDKMAGSLEKSSAALKEKDEVMSALRKEIEELRLKLAEKKD